MDQRNFIQLIKQIFITLTQIFAQAKRMRREAASNYIVSEWFKSRGRYRKDQWCGNNNYDPKECD